MIKNFFKLALLLLPFFSNAQLSQKESNKTEQNLVLKLSGLSLLYSTINFDSAKYYGVHALKLADSINFTSGKIIARCYLGIAYTRSGDIPKALPLQYEALQIAKDNNLSKEEGLCIYSITKS